MGGGSGLNQGVAGWFSAGLHDKNEAESFAVIRWMPYKKVVNGLCLKPHKALAQWSRLG